jgi:cyclopropane fatty-acyl-phospholipid synthase-like methyltransferase
MPQRTAITVLALAVFLTPTRAVMDVTVHQDSARRPDVGFAPTAPAVVDTLLELAGVNANDVVYDLGSGDGRVVIRAAQKYGARAVGVELDATLVKISRQAALENGVADKVTFIEGDLFAADISRATVVTMYLWPSVNARLETKLRQELRPGTRIVSHAFGIGNWRPDQSTRAVDGSLLLLWRVPRAPARAPDVAFVPTPQDVAYEMLQLAGVAAADVVYDLGSGDGRIPILAALRYGARGVGIEIDPRLVEISRDVARDVQLPERVTFIEGDLFTATISHATVVTLCLSASVNEKLESKLRRDLLPGTRIVSRQFALGSWTPDTVVRASDGTNLFLWTVPAR